MPSPPWIPIIVGVAVAAMIGIAVVTSFVRGQPVDVSTLALIAGGWGGGVAITTFAMRIIDRRLWRSVLFRRLPLPNAPPVLHGTWATTISTPSGESAPAYARAGADGYLVIEQRFSAISVRLLYEMGNSEAIEMGSGEANATLRKRSGYWELWFYYDFVPNMAEMENPQRRGAATLRVSPESRRLEGDYWNQLGWRGRVVSKGFVQQIFGDFESADAHFRASASSLPPDAVLHSTSSSDD